MVIIETIISAITSILIVKGIKNIETKKNENGDTLIFADGKQIARLEASLTRIQPLDFIKADIERIVTTQQLRQDDADFIFENPFDKEVGLITLNLVGNTNFNLKGHAEIKINEIAIFTIEAGDLTDVLLDSLPMPQEGIKLKRSKSIEVRIWSDDGSSVALTVLPVVGGFLGV